VLHYSLSSLTLDYFTTIISQSTQVPVDMLELRTSVVAFAWEPLGDRFAIVHGAEVCNTYDVMIIIIIRYLAIVVWYISSVLPLQISE
jgi:uncharacterized protein with WD repeat